MTLKESLKGLDSLDKVLEEKKDLLEACIRVCKSVAEILREYPNNDILWSAYSQLIHVITKAEIPQEVSNG